MCIPQKSWPLLLADRLAGYANMPARIPSRPRPITTRAVRGTLLHGSKVHLPKRSAAEEELLSLLGDLLSVWEAEHVQLPTLAPGALIGALLEARGLPQQALVGPVFSQRSAASEVISGRRALTYRHVQKLAAYFGVSPAVFFPQHSHGQ